MIKIINQKGTRDTGSMVHLNGKDSQGYTILILVVFQEGDSTLIYAYLP